MSAPAYFVDTAVFAYALGDRHDQRAAAQRVVEEAATGRIVLHASMEMVQELLHHRMRRGERTAALRQARSVAGLCILHPFDQPVLDRALELVATSPIRGRDAIHAATALLHGIPRLLSPDADFDVVADLERIPPERLFGP